jgi:serine protease Do
MNKWLTGTLIIVLLVFSLLNGVLYLQASDRASQQEARLSKLAADLGAVSGSLTGIQGSVSQLSTSVNGLNTSVSGLSGKVNAVENSAAGFGSDIAGLKGTTTGLSTDVNGLKTSQASLSTDVTALKSSLTSVNGSIAAVNSSLSALQTSVTGLQGSLASIQANSVSITDLAAKVEPSVVYIRATLTATSGSVGTGVIVRANGYVLTAYHVIQKATAITCTLKSGESLKATVAAVDANLDLAVLKLTSTRSDFPTATLGSSAAAQVGDSVLAVGFAEDLPGQATFSKGIISAFRIDTNLYRNNGEKYIQTDAAINHGNSGGPLFNMKGEVIGINDWKVVSDDGTGDPTESLGFAVAIDQGKSLVTGAAGA